MLNFADYSIDSHQKEEMKFLQLHFYLFERVAQHNTVTTALILQVLQYLDNLA